MDNFFSSIQGMFEKRSSGVYLGQILKAIAEVEPDILKPIIDETCRVLEKKTKSQITPKDIKSIITEFTYDQSEEKRADLAIDVEIAGELASILVEIKINDHFLSGQLDRYIKWAKAKKSRNVIILSVYPLREHEKAAIKSNSKYVSHIYISDFSKEITQLKWINKSELISWLLDYFQNEGYIMHELKSEDLKSLKSFMVLNFLPHVSHHGRVASEEDISRGPEAFGKLIQNWQLISNKFSSQYLGAKRIPTVRYYPEPILKVNESFNDIKNKTDLTISRRRRDYKNGGRYWFVSYNFSKPDGAIIEWGMIIKIDSNEIYYQLYSAIRKVKGEYLSMKINKRKILIKSKNFLNLEDTIGEIEKLVSMVRNEVQKVAN